MNKTCEISANKSQSYYFKKIKKSREKADNIRLMITKKVRNLLNEIQINLISN